MKPPRRPVKDPPACIVERNYLSPGEEGATEPENPDHHIEEPHSFNGADVSEREVLRRDSATLLVEARPRRCGPVDVSIDTETEKNEGEPCRCNGDPNSPWLTCKSD